jgi:hypothetical protein
MLQSPSVIIWWRHKVLGMGIVCLFLVLTNICSGAACVSVYQFLLYCLLFLSRSLEHLGEHLDVLIFLLLLILRISTEILLVSYWYIRWIPWSLHLNLCLLLLLKTGVKANSESGARSHVLCLWRSPRRDRPTSGLVRLVEKPAGFGWFNSVLWERISWNKLKQAETWLAEQSQYGRESGSTSPWVGMQCYVTSFTCPIPAARLFLFDNSCLNID